jgi:hypothetical protein
MDRRSGTIEQSAGFMVPTGQAGESDPWLHLHSWPRRRVDSGRTTSLQLDERPKLALSSTACIGNEAIPATGRWAVRLAAARRH